MNSVNTENGFVEVKRGKQGPLREFNFDLSKLVIEKVRIQINDNLLDPLILMVVHAASLSRLHANKTYVYQKHHICESLNLGQRDLSLMRIEPGC